MPPPTTQTVDYSITQNIPVADHVYKYLKVRCGADHIKASRDTTFGSLALSLLGRNNDMRPKKVKYSKCFKVTVPESAYQKLGMYISPENAQLFNDQVDRLFREDLFFHVIINKGISSKMYLNSIRSFLEVYDISEDDLKIDTVYRDFKRRKEDYDSQLNLTPTSGIK